MSDPRRHRWADQWFFFGDSERCSTHDVRWTRTSGPEWDALMERAREALNAYPHSAVGKEGVLRDLLAYFGESP